MLVTMTLPQGAELQNTVTASAEGAPDLNTQFFVNPAESATPVLYLTTDVSAGAFSASLRDFANLHLQELQQAEYAQQLEKNFGELTFSVSTFNARVAAEEEQRAEPIIVGDIFRSEREQAPAFAPSLAA